MSVSPKRRAASTARLDGAETAQTIGMPAVAAFWMISKLARPETRSTLLGSGRCPASSSEPISLSSALCRPTSSRRPISFPLVSNSAAACRPPVWSNRRCAFRSSGGSPVIVAASTTGPSGMGALHVDHVERRLAADAAAGRRVEVPLRLELEPPRNGDADYVVVLLLARDGAVADVPHVRLPGDQALGEEEADRKLEVVAGRAHGHCDVALLGTGLVDPDLHRLLGRKAVAPPAVLACFDRHDLDLGRAARPLDLGRVSHPAPGARRPVRGCGRCAPRSRPRPRGSAPPGNT